MRNIRGVCAQASVLLLLCLPAAAGTTLSGSVVCTGAGHGANETISVWSAVGQPATGIMANGTYAAESGFWHQQACVLAGVENPERDAVTRCWFGQNHPNPFETSTTIRFSVPRRSHVSLSLYDVTGRHVRTLLDGEVGPGHHLVSLDGAGLACGVYFCRMVSGRFVECRKMVRLK